MIRIILGLLVLIAFTATSSIAESVPFRWYAGSSFGITSFHHGVEDLTDESVGSAQIDDSDTGWKISGGYRFNRYLSAELSYADLNNDFDNETTVAGVMIDPHSDPAEAPISVDIDQPRVLAAALVGTLPFSDSATLFAKAGATSWRADVTTVDREGQSTRSESGTSALLGAGLQFRTTTRTELRLEWERYANVVDADIDLVSIGLVVRFGKGNL